MFRRLPELSQGMEPQPYLHRLYFMAAFHGLRAYVRRDSAFQESARGLMKSLGWVEEEIEEAFTGLLRHHDNQQTVEEMVVHDANYIEMLGAMGIAKAFTTGGARGQSYQETADIFEYRYLDKVAFRTPVGRQMAEDGRAYTKSVLNRLRHELAASEGNEPHGHS